VQFHKDVTSVSWSSRPCSSALVLLHTSHIGKSVSEKEARHCERGLIISKRLVIANGPHHCEDGSSLRKWAAIVGKAGHEVARPFIMNKRLAVTEKNPEETKSIVTASRRPQFLSWTKKFL
jgi:hypothetical protein